MYGSTSLKIKGEVKGGGTKKTEKKRKRQGKNQGENTGTIRLPATTQYADKHVSLS